MIAMIISTSLCYLRTWSYFYQPVICKVICPLPGYLLGLTPLFLLSPVRLSGYWMVSCPSYRLFTWPAVHHPDYLDVHLSVISPCQIIVCLSVDFSHDNPSDQAHTPLIYHPSVCQYSIRQLFILFN
jgi:hypothetical protein